MGGGTLVYDEEFKDCAQLALFPTTCNNNGATLSANAVPPTCANNALQLVASSNQNLTYSWSGPNGFSSQLQNPVINNPTTAANGLYTLRCQLNFCNAPLSQSLNVNFKVPQPVSSDVFPIICEGESYLAQGAWQTVTGIYTDVYKTTLDCDSTIITHLTVKSLKRDTLHKTICAGSNYVLPSGKIESTSGYYHDTVRYFNPGCDSLITTLILKVDSAKTVNISATICKGNTYTLPSGTSVSNPGSYTDVVKHVVSGCDSLITILTLKVDTVKTINTTATICDGNTYTLPSGTTVSSPGNYTDVVKHLVSGCDSLITKLTLKVDSAKTINTKATICEGNTYTLPSGTIVSNPGNYTDVVKHHVSGCDSLITNLTLKVDSAKTINATVTICQGTNYTMPSGTIISNPGNYIDVLKHLVSGCDSLITNLTLIVDSVQTKDTSIAICEGQSYTLPWGGTANAPGVYTNTLRHITSGCDSFIATINVAFYPLPVVNFNPDTVYTTGNNGVQLKPSITGVIDQYLWQPPIGLSPSNTVETPIANPANATIYHLKVTNDKGCIGYGTVDVVNGLPLLMPSSFTPNGDGHNDVYRIPPGVPINLQEFDIYNRWGVLVFFTRNAGQGWDGTLAGNPQPPGTYIYKVRGTKLNGEPVLLRGTIVLAR